LDPLSREDKARLGVEIRRARERKPRISRMALVRASESTLSENTVLAVERGDAIDSSFERVIAALRSLGRDVHASIDSAPDDEAVVQLVAAVLRAAPEEERGALARNIWLLVRGQHDELMDRLK
jgi:hypothetical protein